MELTRKRYESMSFEEIIDMLENEGSITSSDTLKNYAIEQIENDMFLCAINVLEVLNNNYTDYYIYDYSMGALETPTPIESKADIEHLIDFKED